MSRALVIGGGGALGIGLLGVVLLASPGQGDRIYLTAPIATGDVRTEVTATGTLEALVTVKVGSQLSGQIAELFVDFNDEVAKGQVLAELDGAAYRARVRQAEAALQVAEASLLHERAAIARAEADLESAKARREVHDARVANLRAETDMSRLELRRAESLVDRQALARSELDRAMAEHQTDMAQLRGAIAERELQEPAIRAAEASLTMARANLASAEATLERERAALAQTRVDLERTTIRSPTDGLVIGRNVDRGQTVAASLEAPTLFTIAEDLSRMEVHAKLDEADIGRIRVGQNARFTVDAYPERSFSGTVSQIRKASQVIQNVVTYTVLIAADNKDLVLLPGMTAIVHIAVEEREDVLTVPNAALRFQPPADATWQEARAAAGSEAEGAATVWIRGDAGTLRPVQIAVGVRDETLSELVSGPLGEGDQVIVGIALEGSETPDGRAGP